MKLIIVFLIFLTIIFFLVRYKPRVVLPVTVTVNEVPRVFAKLKANGADGAFATFAFLPDNAQGGEDAVNIQFSVENGRIGLDWVLEGPTNIRDQEKINVFMRGEGFMPERREVNDVAYWRVEKGDLAALCQNLIREVYHKPPDMPLEFIYEGFRWP